MRAERKYDWRMSKRETTTAKRSAGAGAVEGTQAYQLAVAAGDRAWDDATAMKKEPLLASIAPQLVRAAGSIAANVTEGYARRSPRDRIRYYEYALGSSEETRSWYAIGGRVLSAEDRDDRLARLTSLRRLLLVMIKNERTGKAWNSPRRPPP